MVTTGERDEAPEILEQGNIYFLFRPRVASAEADETVVEGSGDIQNFHLALKPEDGPFRLVTIGRRRLPDVARHERLWGFVEAITDSAKELESALQEHGYETETRGERVLPAARPAGEGVYALVREGGDMRLAWCLELPEEPGEVQRAFNLPEEASLVVSVRNPEKPAPPSAQLGEKDRADYPDELQETFRGRKFATEEPRLLDEEGAEILFVGARENPAEAYAIDFEPAEEDERSAEIFKELRFAKSRHPVEPLFGGEWR
jgi:hypothetical protein